MIRVIVCGAAGRMGREVVKAVTAEPDMTLVAAVDPPAAGTTIGDGAGTAIEVAGDLASALKSTPADVVVDFTRPDTVAANVGLALAAGVDCVVGTTGVADEALHMLAATAAPDTCLFVAPNFAIGAVLMMRFAEMAARHLPHVEVIELHHDRKLDAPSGTAARTARLIAAARSRSPEVPGVDTEIAACARGAVIDGVHVHSVRLPGLVAHQEVVFGGQGQTLSIRHDSVDRTSFMPGVIMAIRAVRQRAGLIVGLENLMEDDGV